MVLVGNNTFVDDLRVLTSLELFLNASFYSKHPCFLAAAAEHKEEFGKSKNLNNLLPLSVSEKCFDSGFSKDELVKKEAMLNCNDKEWSSFLCILGLSSVINRNIITYYPDCGAHRSKLLFNRHIKPRSPSQSQSQASLEDVHILFCFEGGIKSGDAFKSNHFVPLLFYATGQKRKKSQLSHKPYKKIAPVRNTCISNPSMTQTQKISSFFTPSEQKFAPRQKTACMSSTSTSDSRSNNQNPSSSITLAESTCTSTTNSENSLVDITEPSTSVNSGLTNVADSNAVVAHPNNEFDVAFCREKVKTMNNSQIENLIKNIFKPDRSYSFPKSDGRSFRYEWLQLFPWLCYSPLKDGAYCLSCVLFGDRFPGKTSKIKRLFSEPLTHWSNATYSFKQHAGVGTGQKKGLHDSTSTLFTSFLARMSGQIQSIDVLVDNNLRKTIAENRKKLVPIIDTIKLCGHLALALRGHRDDSKYHPEVGSYSEGRVGNFIELLNFRIRAGDIILEEHLKTCAKNASYISKTSQNELIKCCGQVITDQIIEEVKQSKFYSIIADEASDCSDKEQMSLVLRFVDKDMNIREDFIKFLHCKWGLTGAGLATLVLEALNDLTLNIQDCRGQGYDGAGAVAGHINGLSAHILNLNKKALYTHCFSHRLNLTVCESTSVPLVRNVLTQIKEISDFFNVSEPRQMILDKNILEHGSVEVRKNKLVNVCRTRWVARISGMDTFEELFVPIFYTLDEMSSNLEKKCNPKTSSDASSLLTLISSFKFIATLVITRNIFDLTLPVTQLLQSKSIDIMNGIELVNTLKNLVMTIRNSIDFYHEKWYQQAVALASKLDIEESLPRTARRQTTRDNHPATDACEYFKRAITIPLIDHVNSALQTRFDLNSINVYNGVSIVPEKLIHLASEQVDWKETFKLFSNFYLDDLPNPLALDAELELWEKYWESYKGPRPDSVATTLKAINFEAFDNIKVALRILATLPITSCECERSFSSLRRLKDYKRSTMVEERLNGLALMHIHPEIEPNVNKVIDKFSVSNRRLDF